MGELELNFGSRAVEEKRYEDAIEHFSAGAKLSSPGSMFNLGLCYELGLGTSMNYAKVCLPEHVYFLNQMYTFFTSFQLFITIFLGCKVLQTSSR